ncbi:MAG: hypothetical protein QOI58_1675 [Thermoanaerobaculia bacterium]|jgi:hypothetical protein|nr:hypothetical protein [Thermoanaerobaculia bacterium]
MRLQSALGLKEELNYFFSSFRDGDSQSSFAIGVAPGSQPEQFALAVRAATENDLIREDLEVLTTKAGGEIDVRYTGAILPLGSAAPTAATGCHIGASVAHHRCTAGTLGFFAAKHDGTIGIVSNNHVLAISDEGNDEDEIVQPSPSDGGERPRDVIARLDGTYPRLNRGKVRVDCAFARLVRDVEYDALALEGMEKLSMVTAQPEEHTEVCKIGRTTGTTFGRISAFELDRVAVNYDRWRIRLNGQIEIESINGKPFSRGGDSGSLVFSRSAHRPIGLLFASSLLGGAGNVGLTYANKIDDVLAELGVTFLP